MKKTQTHNQKASKPKASKPKASIPTVPAPSARPDTADTTSESSAVTLTPTKSAGQDSAAAVLSPALNSDSPGSNNPAGEQPIMNITFTRNTATRKSLAEVFTAEGYPGSVRFSKTLFVNKAAPDSIIIGNDAFTGPRTKETPDERKARLKAMPKLTDAEKLAKIEVKAAKLRAKVQGTAAAV